MNRQNVKSLAGIELAGIDAALMMLMAAAVMLSGCETVSERTIALPPPAFDPGAYSVEPMHTVFYLDADPSLIEPAAGETVAIVRKDACRSRGGSEGAGTLSYRWGGNSFGLGFGGVGPSESGDAMAALRYSFSLQTGSSSACGGGNALLDELRSRFH